MKSRDHLTAEQVERILREIVWNSEQAMECPIGYEFVDANGNVIDTKKIALRKKKVYAYGIEVTDEMCEKMFEGCTKVDTSKVIESFAQLKDTGAVERLEQAKRDIIKPVYNKLNYE